MAKPDAWDEVQVLEKLYRQDTNPVHALNAYRLCRINRLSIPEWVMLWLDTGINGYLDSKGGQSIERLLGLNPGRGKKRPFDAMNDQHLFIGRMTEMELLKRMFNISVGDAAYMIQEQQIGNRNSISADTLEDYYWRKWRGSIWDKFLGYLYDAAMRSGGEYPRSKKLEFLGCFPEHSIPPVLKSRYLDT